MANVATGTMEERMVWLETHRQLWESDPQSLGLTSEDVLALGAMLTAVREADRAAEVARQASRNATTQLNVSLEAAQARGSALSRRIQSYIDETQDETLWSRAGLTPPARRGEAPPPVAPTSLFAALDSLGNLRITWHARQPRGTQGAVYVVRRQLDGEANFTLLEVVGGKALVDRTIPRGTTGVRYVVHTRRGESLSAPSPVLAVRFGSLDAGKSAMTITARAA
ncbi:MAG: hypothetical protein IPK69_10200 [Phycisphaerales bacterium]|nr:MAG: hypothetical protein IPK69_10200 [Phycisphaerales bacterium]